MTYQNQQGRSSLILIPAGSRGPDRDTLTQILREHAQTCRRVGPIRPYVASDPEPHGLAYYLVNLDFEPPVSVLLGQDQGRREFAIFQDPATPTEVRAFIRGEPRVQEERLRIEVGWCFPVSGRHDRVNRLVAAVREVAPIVYEARRPSAVATGKEGQSHSPHI